MIYKLRRCLYVAVFFVIYSCSQKESIPLVVPALTPCSKNVVAGYTNKTSYFPGDIAEVYIQAVDTFQCALGIYDQSGKQAFSSNVEIYKQNSAVDEPWKYGFNFLIYSEIKIPTTLSSGIYFIENKIPLVVKASGQADVTVVYPINTLNAYNSSGGKSLYNFNSSDKEGSPVVSYLRPLNDDEEEDRCSECLKWFHTLGDVRFKYISDQDLDDYSAISSSKILLIPGHSEYWTRKARENFDRFVESGGNAILLSGNSMWWQVRYSEDRDQMICYRKEEFDPEPDPLQKTVQWANPILEYSIIKSIGADFNHGGYGLRNDSGWDGFRILNGSSPLLEGLGLQRGATVSLPSDECDGAPFTRFDNDGFPILENENNFEKLELIGFDRGSRGGVETFPMFIALKPKPNSGVIVNMGASDWCSSTGIGNPNGQAKTITRNAIRKLLSGSTVFSK